MFKRELRLVVTEDCNYDCVFCHKEGMKRHEKTELTKDDYCFLFKFCKDYYSWDEITITGGEPFIRKDIDDIIKTIYELGGKITVVTNGELINKHVDSLKYLSRINLSIHSLNEEKYHGLIQKKDKFNKILENLATIRNLYSDINIRLNAVVVRGLNNDEECIKEYINFAKKIKASIKFVELYSKEKEKIVSIEEIAKILQTLGYKYTDIANISKQDLTDGETTIVLSRIFCANVKIQHDPEAYCNKYNDLFITPAGKINICRESKEDIDIYSELKARNVNGLKKKIDFAIESIGKNCPHNKEEKKLAVNGGMPTFSKNEDAKFIHPKITKELETAVLEQLHDTISIYDNSNIFAKFENDFAKYHDRKYALTFSSGTAAIWGMYEGINLKNGDEVICPNYTFFATVTPILLTGAIPVLIDCGEDGNIEVKDVEKNITDKTKAIVVTHMWGYPCQMDKLRKIADEHGIYLLEDCSHAHGAKYQNKKVGSISDAAVFSLQGQKIISGGEGGVLVTNNKMIKERALLLGHYNKRCRVEINKESNFYKYAITGKGMKLRAHPIAIRIAYEQFKYLDKTNSVKNSFAKLIAKEIQNIKGLKVIEQNPECTNSWYAMIIKYDKEEMHGVTRERFVQALHKEGAIEIDIPDSTAPLNTLELFQKPEELYPEYKGKFSYSKEQFQKSQEFYQSIIKVPVWYEKEDEQKVVKYIRAIKKVCNNIKELM